MHRTGAHVLCVCRYDICNVGVDGGRGCQRLLQFASVVRWWWWWWLVYVCGGDGSGQVAGPAHGFWAHLLTFCLLAMLPHLNGSHGSSCPLLFCSAAVLERSLKRLEWDKVRERELQEAADEAERERLAYQSVDW